MILLTGATGTIGSELLPRLLESGHRVRTLVRQPRRLGERRVDVQIALGNLADPFSIRHAMRGVDVVVHLAATIRDQPAGTIEELNGLATLRLLRLAERAGVERFVFFSAIGAASFQRTRFFRSKWLAERAVRRSPVPSIVFAPSIVYAPDDPWIGLLRRFGTLPAMPISGSGEARYEPIWAGDVAGCVAGALAGRRAAVANGGEDGGEADGDRRFELGGPEVLSYEEIARLALRSEGRDRPLLHVPLTLVRAGLRALEAAPGVRPFATWEEAELMEVPMVSERGVADARSLGVDPRPMAEVVSPMASSR